MTNKSTLQKLIANYVPREISNTGTKVEVESAGRMVESTLFQLPFECMTVEANLVQCTLRYCEIYDGEIVYKIELKAYRSENFVEDEGFNAKKLISRRGNEAAPPLPEEHWINLKTGRINGDFLEDQLGISHADREKIDASALATVNKGGDEHKSWIKRLIPVQNEEGKYDEPALDLTLQPLYVNGEFASFPVGIQTINSFPVRFRLNQRDMRDTEAKYKRGFGRRTEGNSLKPNVANMSEVAF